MPILYVLFWQPPLPSFDGTMAIFLVHRKKVLVSRFFRPCNLLLQVTAAAAVAAARAVMHILPAPASERVPAFPVSFSCELLNLKGYGPYCYFCAVA